jgi:hypothetical protein
MEDTVELSPTGFVEKEGRVIRSCIPNLKIMGFHFCYYFTGDTLRIHHLISILYSYYTHIIPILYPYYTHNPCPRVQPKPRIAWGPGLDKLTHSSPA